MGLTVKDMTRVSLFTALAIAAAVMLRIGGAVVVPFSLLPLVVMLAGLLLGGRLAALSMTIYLLLGLVGIPVFNKPPYGGFTYVFQPTFGFLIGFIAAGYVIGKLIALKTKPSLLWLVGSGIVGSLVIYMIGLPYMYMILKFYIGKNVSAAWVIEQGMLPFIAFDIGKAVVAALIARPLNERLGAVIHKR